MSVTMTVPDIDSRDYYEQVSNVGDKTPLKVLVAILEDWYGSLNHEDEYFIPVIKQAIKRLEKQE